MILKNAIVLFITTCLLFLAFYFIKDDMIKILSPAGSYKPNDIKKILNKRIKKKIAAYNILLPKYFF